MKIKRLFALFLILAQGGISLFGASFGGSPGADTPNPLIVDQENNIRREAELKIQNEILNRILGEGLATVLVNVEISLESERKESANSEGKVEDNKGLGDQDFILPWVPAPKTVNKASEVPKDAKMESAAGEIAQASVRQLISRFDVTVIHDESVSKAQLTLVDEAIRSAYKRYEKVLSVIFKVTRFAKFEMKEKMKENFWNFLKPQFLLPGLITLLLFSFLFGPLWAFLRALLKSMNNKKASDVNSQTNMKFEGQEENKNEDEVEAEEEGLSAEEQAAQLEAEEMANKEEKYVPFTYIDETNLKRLIYLLHREPPDVIAVSVSYLKPEFIKEVLNSFPPALQAKVAMSMAAVKLVTEEEIKALDADIKMKIDFLVGGLGSLLKVMDDVNYSTRDNIMEYLKNERPNLYEKVRKQILLFDDIVTIPDPALQIVLRELKAETLAKALQDAAPAIRDKIFGNMSQGAAALLKEEMDFGRPLTQEQIREERQKILNIVKSLETAGKIAFREKTGDDFLDLEDMEFVTGNGLVGFNQRNAAAAAAKTPPAAPAAETPAADPVKAQEYSTAGAQFYGEGRYNEALSYFQYAASLDASSADIFQYLGNTHYAMGQYPEALAAFERVVQLRPEDPAFKEWVEQFRASIGAPASS